MRRLLRILAKTVGAAVLALVMLVVALAAPILWIETGCRPQGVAEARSMIVSEEHHRNAARTLLTYPEWHIVHAYDDYASTIRNGDPHDFDFIASVWGFWSSLCTLSRASGPLGGFDAETKQTIYTIGVSFGLEMLGKAAYEETIGRLFTLLRGPERSRLDEVSAQQATDYAAFLEQVPWYRWDFTFAADQLAALATPSLRDRERNFALGLENRLKAIYARAIAAAVAGIGHDALRMRVVVSGRTLAELTHMPGVTVIAEHPEGIEIETPRYADFRLLAQRLAARPNTIAGTATGPAGEFVEIAGNDRIMLTALGPENPGRPDVLLSLRRGTDHPRPEARPDAQWRHILLMPVADLARFLREQSEGMPRPDRLTLEHIHDY